MQIFKRNVFTSSMFYFVPLASVNKRCFKHFEEYKKKIDVATFVHNPYADLFYASLENLPINHIDTQCEFLFRPSKNRHPYSLMVQSYLLKLCPKDSKDTNLWILAIGTHIDKYFKDTKGQSCLCTTDDLVRLKQAMTEKGRNGLYCDKTYPAIYFHNWVKDLINAIQIVNIKNVSLEYMLVNVKGVSLHMPLWFVDRRFEHKFFYSKRTSLYESLEGDIPRFAYGLQNSNDNYMNATEECLHESFRNSWSNCISERLYAADMNIVFIQSHHPFSPTGKAVLQNRLSPFNLEWQPCIYEMSVAIYLNELLRKLNNKMGDAGPLTIKAAMEYASDMAVKKQFNVSDLDERLNLILSVWKFNKLLDAQIKKGQSKVDTFNLSFMIIVNIMMIVLSMIMLFKSDSNSSNQIISTNMDFGFCISSPQLICGMFIIVAILISVLLYNVFKIRKVLENLANR